MKTLLVLLLLVPNLIWSSDIMHVVDKICYSKSQEEFLECSDSIPLDGYDNEIKDGGYIDVIANEDLYKMYQKCLNGNEKICSYFDEILYRNSNISKPNFANDL